MRSVKELKFDEKKLSAMKEVSSSIKVSENLKSCGVSLYYLDKEKRELHKEDLGYPLSSTDYLILQSPNINTNIEKDYFHEEGSINLEELNACTYAFFGFTPEDGVVSFMEDYLDKDGILKL